MQVLRSCEAAKEEGRVEMCNIALNTRPFAPCWRSHAFAVHSTFDRRATLVQPPPMRRFTTANMRDAADPVAGRRATPEGNAGAKIPARSESCP